MCFKVSSIFSGVLRYFKSWRQKQFGDFSLNMLLLFLPLFFLLQSFSLCVTVRTLRFPWPAAGSPEALRAKTKPWECPLHSLDNSAGGSGLTSKRAPTRRWLIAFPPSIQTTRHTPAISFCPTCTFLKQTASSPASDGQLPITRP